MDEVRKTQIKRHVDPEVYQKAFSAAIIGKLISMSNHPEKWCLK